MRQKKMDCACVYVDVDEGPQDFYHASIQKARKQHACCECGRNIGVGEAYERVVGKWDGELSTYKTCPECLSIRDAFFCEGFYFKQIIEFVKNHIEEMDGAVSSKTMAQLTPKARARIIDLIDGIITKQIEKEASAVCRNL